MMKDLLSTAGAHSRTSLSNWCLKTSNRLWRKGLGFGLAAFSLLFFSTQAQSQITLTTASGTNYTGANGVTGSSAVTFVVENSNAVDYLLTDIGVFWQTANNNTNVQLWMTSSSISGAATIDTPLWTSVATAGPIAVATNDYYPTFTGLSILIPANAVIRFAIQSSTGIRYSGAAGPPAPSAFTSGGISLYSGDHSINSAVVGYGGAFPTPTNTPRWFTGSVTLIPALPCVSPPTAGTLSATDTILCPGSSSILGLVGTSFGTGQTYQWQESSDNVSWSNITGATTPSYTATPSAATYYRCEITCSAQSVTTPSQLLTILGPAYSGVYTVDPTQPNSATNFQDLVTALNNIGCVGIAGPVTINVATGSGPYIGQVIMPAVSGSSPTNTITVNGNGAVLQYASSNSNERATLKLDATSHISFKNLHIKAIGTTTTEFGFTVQLMNGANFVTFDSCIIESNTDLTSTNYAALVTSNGATSATTAGLAAENLTVTNCEIIGGYYGIVSNGPTAAPFAMNNNISNNIIRDFYQYGLYVRGNQASAFNNNDIHRTNRNVISTFYGIYLTASQEGNVFNANRIHDDATSGSTTAASYPIYITGASGSSIDPYTFSNNAIYNISGNGTTYGIYILGVSDHYRFYHNTVLLENMNHPGSSTIAGFYTTTTGVANGELKNNIFHINNSSSGTQYLLWWSNATSVPINDNNVLSNLPGNPAATIVTARLGTTNYATLADWQLVASNAYDQNSVSANPLVVGASIGDLSPLSPAVNNMAAPLGITTDLVGAPRSATTPDPGAVEFVPVLSDLALINASLSRALCYSSNDTAEVLIQNVIGASIDFSVNPLTVSWNVAGSRSSNGSTTLSSGTLANGDTLIVRFGGVDMNGPGVYVLNARIDTNAYNTVASNDSVSGVQLTVGALLSTSQSATSLFNTTDTVDISAVSRFMPTSGEPFITEICHFKTATGTPASGWPSYLLADDYIEVTWSPGADLAGYTLEQWSTSSLSGTFTFPTGTLIGPNGTAVIAVGQLNSSVPDPASYYYHGNGTFTATWGSTTAAGRILKDASGTIVDAVGYGTYTFPVASGVDTTHWSGNTPGISSSGNRLEGPYTKNAANWVNSGVSPQDPNVLNAGVPLPIPPAAPGFVWTLNGATIATTPSTTVGPFTTSGVYNYVAEYTTSQCGLLTDTVTITVDVFNNPCPITTLPTTTGATSCGTSPAVLTGTAGDMNAYVIWVDSNVMVRGDGGSFAAPIQAADQNFNAHDVRLSTPGVSAGPPTSITTGGFGNFSNGMYITALDFMRWDSTTLRVSGNVFGTIRVWNANPSEDTSAIVLQTKPYAVNGSGDITIPVGITLAPGSYYVNITFGGGGQLWRSTGGASYPYVTPGIASIDSAWLGAGSTGNLTRVYYFFEWVISGACVGPATPTLAEGTAGNTEVTVFVRTDRYGDENSWVLRDATTGAVYGTGGPYPEVNPYDSTAATHITTVCVPDGANVTFRIDDSFGDGLDDGTIEGEYRVTIPCNGAPYVLTSGSAAFAFGGGAANVLAWDSANFTINCLPAVTLVPVTFRVDMSRETVSTDGVHIAGAFQGWNPSATPLTDQGNGIWSVTVDLPEDSTYEFKFINGNQWGPGFDEAVPAACAQNGNRFVVVASAPVTTPLVCFGRCEACGVSVFEAGSLSSAVKVYPNPASSEVFIDFNFEMPTDLVIHVYDARGHVVKQINHNDITNANTRLEVSNWADGLYIVRMTSGAEQLTQRIVVNKK